MALTATDSVAVSEPPATWRRDNYIPFATSRVLSALGSQGMAISLGWLVYDKTNSAFDLGFIGLCQFLPMVVLTFVVGQVADRFDRRRVALACQLTKSVVAILVCLGIWRDWLTVPEIFAAVLVTGSAQAFEQPTMQSLVPSIVPASFLQQALSMTTAVTQTATIVGPTFGGVLYGFNPLAPFLASAVFFVLASACVVTIKTIRGGMSRKPVTLESIFGGVNFIFTRKVMLGIISLDLFAVLLGGVTALLPIFAKDILNVGPWAFGMLRSAPAIGGILMSLLITRIPLKRHVGAKMFAAVSAFGILTVLFSLSNNIVLSALILVALGASDTVSVVVRITLVQLLTPDSMRGRVNAVNSLFVGTSNQLGAFYSGTLAGFFGPIAAGVIGGISTIVIVLTWMRVFPELRRLDRLQTTAEK